MVSLKKGSSWERKTSTPSSRSFQVTVRVPVRRPSVLLFLLRWSWGPQVGSKERRWVSSYEKSVLKQYSYTTFVDQSFRMS